jgi:hypothetical protein
VLAALKGDILLVDRVMADYVLSPGSSLMAKGSLMWYKTDAQFYEHIESALPKRWHRLVRAEKGKRYQALAFALRQQGDFGASRAAAFKAFCSPAPLDNIATKTKALVTAMAGEIKWRFRRTRSERTAGTA